MTLRMKQALAGLALAGALVGGGASVAWGQSDSSSSSSTSSSQSDSGSSSSSTAPSTTPPAQGSNANCPGM